LNVSLGSSLVLSIAGLAPVSRSYAMLTDIATFQLLLDALQSIDQCVL
jgi:hypothetical protein